MGNINSSIFDFIQIGVIASGGDPNGKGSNRGDHPSDKSSNQKVILPSVHDPNNVKQEHLAFSPLMHSPTSLSQVSFPGAMDPGSLVYFLKMPGQTQGIILGQANDQVNYDKGAGGGQNLLNAQYFQQLFDRETGILIPPDIQETEEDGVKVKSIKEKDKKHKHSLLRGLPSHNALQSTTGYKLQEIKEVPTAKQKFNALPTNDMMGMIPGDPMSLGGMFQGLMGGMSGGGGGGQGAGAGAGTGAGTTPTANAQFSVSYLETPMDRIKTNVSPEIYDAMSSLSTLVQGDAASSVASFPTANRVHSETYLANAEELLSQVTNIEDLLVVLHRLQHDESLFGLENIPDVILTMETAWGNANTIISATGEFSLEYANSNISNTFAQSLSSPSSSPSSGGNGGGGKGGGGIGNMFGKSSGIMQDMFKRLAPNNEKESKKMTEKLNQSDTAQKLWKFAETTLKGGNPLDPSNFA
jgi:hypothetical protein